MNLPDETSRQLRIRQIVAEYRESIRGGGSPNVEEVLARHPELGDELRSQLRAVTAETPTLPPSPLTAVAGDVTTAHESDSSMGRAGEPVMPGTQVGEYRLLRELGRGGMGVVYEAEHLGSDRRLAVKLLSPQLPHTEQTITRFLNEASLAAGLSHPRTTFVYEAGERDGHFFISMELMPGRTLKDVVTSEGALPVNRAVDFILDVLAGLDAAHKSGVVHRDVKPSNCFLDEAGRIKVGDFGLSKSLLSTSDLTLSGTFLGTPQFAAPEQFGRGTVDHRTDVFATAATLYYLLAGEAPFRGDAAAVIAQIVADDPPLLSSLKPDVPASLSRVVARGLSKDPKRRYKDASEFSNALMPYATGGTSTAALGRRVAAFFLDTILVTVVVSILMAVYLLARWGLQSATTAVNYNSVHGVVFLLYFAVWEGLFGRSLGKRWLGLRVADQNGEPPGMLRAVLRALIVPGLSWVSVDFIQARYSPNWQPTDGTPFDYSMILIPQFLLVLRGVLCLTVCSSMRRSNGYRGLHELISRTRVVRPRVLETTTNLAAVPCYAGVIAQESRESIGGFSVGGQLMSTGSSQILVARDDQLDRPVWIQLGGPEIAVSRSRRNVSRSTRQRWLAEGKHNDRHWQAFEAISGAPLPEVARYATIPWDTARHIWLQAAEEVKISLEDDTLPEQVAVDQIWTDAHGHVRLCDQPMLGSNEDARGASSPSNSANDGVGDDTGITTDIERATQLLADVGELCTADDETPADALDLLQKLQSRSSPATSPDLVVKQLDQLAGRPYRLRWDDRLGSLAIAAGLESALLSPIPTAIGSVLTNYQWSPALTMSLATTTGIATSALLGYLMQGGLAFWLTGVEIRANAGRASPARCAWRNAVTWLPMMLLNATIGITVGTLIRTGGVPESPIGLITSAIYQMVFGAAAVIGVLYALLQPRQGLQDLLSGTFLVRRVSS